MWQLSLAVASLDRKVLGANAGDFLIVWPRKPSKKGKSQTGKKKGPPIGGSTDLRSAHYIDVFMTSSLRDRTRSTGTSNRSFQVHFPLRSRPQSVHRGLPPQTNYNGNVLPRRPEIGSYGTGNRSRYRPRIGP